MSEEVNFKHVNIIITSILFLIFFNSDKVKENIAFKQINENQNLNVARVLGEVINKTNESSDIKVESYIKKILKEVNIEDDKFGFALGLLFEVEGGYTNDPHDRGGRTKYGIAQNFDGRRHNIDVKNITRADAALIYYNDYWIESGANKENLYLATAIFNAYVHAGRKFNIDKTSDDYTNGIRYLERTDTYYDALDPKFFARYMIGYKRRTEFFKNSFAFHKDPTNNSKPKW